MLEQDAAFWIQRVDQLLKEVVNRADDSALAVSIKRQVEESGAELEIKKGSNPAVSVRWVVERSEPSGLGERVWARATEHFA
jgi:hypothetical protein